MYHLKVVEPPYSLRTARRVSFVGSLLYAPCYTRISTLVGVPLARRAKCAYAPYFFPSLAGYNDVSGTETDGTSRQVRFW